MKVHTHWVSRNNRRTQTRIAGERTKSFMLENSVAKMQDDVTN